MFLKFFAIRRFNKDLYWAIYDTTLIIINNKKKRRGRRQWLLNVSVK